MTRAVLAGPELTKSLTELAVGGALRRSRERAQWEYDTAKERTQQVQLHIGGTAGGIAAWTTVQVPFSIYFHCSPGNRDSNLIYPHYTYGYVIHTGTPIMVACQVTSWVRDGNLTVTAADITWGAWAPDNPATPIPFTGAIHMNFQGFGAPPDVDNSQLQDNNGALSTAPSPVTAGDDV